MEFLEKLLGMTENVKSGLQSHKIEMFSDFLLNK